MSSVPSYELLPFATSAVVAETMDDILNAATNGVALSAATDVIQLVLNALGERNKHFPMDDSNLPSYIISPASSSSKSSGFAAIVIEDLLESVVHGAEARKNFLQTDSLKLPPSLSTASRGIAASVVEDLLKSVTHATGERKNTLPTESSKFPTSIKSPAESSSESDSASSFSSEPPASKPCPSQSHASPSTSYAPLRRIVAELLEDGSADRDMKPLRSKNELDPAEVPIQRPNITISMNDEILPVGQISSIVDVIAVVSSGKWSVNNDEGRHPPHSCAWRGYPGTRTDLAFVTALDHGSALCFEDRSLLGLVDETFGPVEAPFYVVRFNSSEECLSIAQRTGRNIFAVRRQSQWIKGSEVIKKGYDTSNNDDEESHLPKDYSDDDEERAAKRAKRKPKSQGRGREPATGVHKRQRMEQFRKGQYGADRRYGAPPNDRLRYQHGFDRR